MEVEQYKTKIDMQEEKFTSKKVLYKECTSKDFDDGTIAKFEAKVFQDGRWLHKKKKRKKKVAKNKLDSYKNNKKKKKRRREREQKEDNQPISEWSCET